MQAFALRLDTLIIKAIRISSPSSHSNYYQRVFSSITGAGCGDGIVPVTARFPSCIGGNIVWGSKMAFFRLMQQQQRGQTVRGVCAELGALAGALGLAKRGGWWGSVPAVATVGGSRCCCWSRVRFDLVLSLCCARAPSVLREPGASTWLGSAPASLLAGGSPGLRLPNCRVLFLAWFPEEKKLMRLYCLSVLFLPAASS